MQLAACPEGQVVRNVNNGRFYRVEGPEEGRMRIRPLELFPNGLVIEKPTDTIVEPGLLVEPVGAWEPDFRVEDRPTKKRSTFERELDASRLRLDVLQAENLVLDPKKRGSHANVIKAVERRIDVLQRGLAEITCESHTAAVEIAVSRFARRQIVQLPSGIPALVLTATTKQTVKVRHRTGELRVPVEVLRPYEHASLATV